MSAPLNRAQRILQFIAGSKKPVSLQQIATAVAIEHADTGARFTTLVAAQLHQLTKNGKVTRAGKPQGYTYAPSPLTLIDGRKFDRDGNPRPGRKPRIRPPRKQAAKRTPPAPKVKRVTDSPRLVGARIKVKAARPAGERETVEEFEARGGHIQKLKHGECSRPMYETARDLSQASMRKRLAAAADNDDTTDSELAVA